MCSGIRGEKTCLPCLHGCRNEGSVALKQDGDDMCMICFTEAISAAPAIQVTIISYNILFFLTHNSHKMRITLTINVQNLNLEFRIYLLYIIICILYFYP